MASIITTAKKSISGSIKGGFGSGMVAGIAQGIPAALGFHPFIARLGGGLIATTIVKNATDKRIILVEAMKESIYQLFGAD